MEASAPSTAAPRQAASNDHRMVRHISAGCFTGLLGLILGLLASVGHLSAQLDEPSLMALKTLGPGVLITSGVLGGGLGLLSGALIGVVASSRLYAIAHEEDEKALPSESETAAPPDGPSDTATGKPSS